jgi:arsenite methyltransferase
MTWFEQLLGTALPADGGFAAAHGRRLVMQDGLLRDTDVLKPAQQQTSDTFAFKWAQQHTYNSSIVQELTKKWLVSRYGEWDRPEDWKRFSGPPVVLDAGCGAGLTASLLFGEMVNRMHFVGADVSRAVDIAAHNFQSRGWQGSFLQADLLALPFSKASFDFILSEGVLHHTPSTRGALLTLSEHLKPGGVFVFYVYARKGLLREFSDELDS